MSKKQIKLKWYRYNAYKKICKCILPSYSILIEANIHEYCVQYLNKRDISQDYFQKIYNSRIAEICFNLDQENSPFFIIKILNGEIDVSQIATLKCTDISPEKWKVILDKREYAEYKRNNMGATKAYICRKCGGNKHTAYSLQTRSCDEPMTIFVHCQQCKYEFRKY